MRHDIKIMLHRMDISQMKYIFHYTFTIRFSLHILKRKGVNCKKKSFVWPVPSHSTSRVKTKVMEEKNVHNHNIVNISLKRLKKNIIRIFSKYYPDLSYSSSNDKFFLLYCPKSTPIIQFHWNEQVSLSNWNRIERILPVLKKMKYVVANTSIVHSIHEHISSRYPAEEQHGA